TLRLALAAAIFAATAATLGAADEKAYPDGADGLKALWTDVLTKAQAGQDDAVRGMLEKMTMADTDFAAVIADDAKAKDVSAKYAERFAKTWPNEAKNILAKVKERKYDEVEATEVTAAAEQQTANDKKVIAALKPGTKMYR